MVCDARSQRSLQGKDVLKLDVTLSYENEGYVKRIMHHMNMSEEHARQMFEDVKKFLFMVATHPNQKFDPPYHIDRAWEHFILFTEEYIAFCNTYLYGYVHHVPGESRLFIYSGKARGETLALAKKLFGDLSQHWTTPIG